MTHNLKSGTQDYLCSTQDILILKCPKHNNLCNLSRVLFLKSPAQYLRCSVLSMQRAAVLTSTPTPHTVQVRTVHQHVVRREAPAPVPEVRTGGLYRGAPCTAGTKDRLHRRLCAPSVFSKSRTLLANMTKMSEAYPQTLKKQLL